MRNFYVDSLFDKNIQGEKKDNLKKVRELQIYVEHAPPA